jgi:hypothetical protein
MLTAVTRSAVPGTQVKFGIDDYPETYDKFEDLANVIRLSQCLTTNATVASGWVAQLIQGPARLASAGADACAPASIS